MKEATGDMTMTIVVIVGIVAVLTLGTTVIWPAIRNKITNETNNIDTSNNKYKISYVELIDNYNI